MMGEKGIKGTLSVFLFIRLDTWISDTSNLTDRDTEKSFFHTFGSLALWSLESRVLAKFVWSLGSLGSLFFHLFRVLISFETNRRLNPRAKVN